MLALALGLFALMACVAPQASSPLVYEIIAQAVAYSGGSDSPILLALEGASVATAALDGFPPELAAALRTAAAADPTALYVVVYAGKQPGGGFSVTIDAITASQASDSLIVAYSLTSPDPRSGGTTALTFPYVVARVRNAGVPAANVQFKGPW